MKFFSNFGAKQKTVVILLALVVVLFVLEQVGVMGILQAPLQRFFQPVQLALYKTQRDFGGFLGTLAEMGSLRKKETQFAYENALLQAENARLKKLESENKILREQLGAKQDSWELTLAQVVGQSPLFPGSELLVDKGKNSGVRMGAIVVLKNILIGQVVSVGASSASVRLLSDPETKIPAVTAGGVKGILHGEFGNQIVLEKLAQGEKLAVGEIVYTLGEVDFPKGLVIGKITQVSNDPASLFQKANIDPLIASKLLETVFIIK